MFFNPNYDPADDYHTQVIDNAFSVAKLALGFNTVRKTELERALRSANETLATTMQNIKNPGSYESEAKIAKAEDNADLLTNMLEHLRRKATWEIAGRWKEGRKPVTPAKVAYTKSLLAGIDWDKVLKWRNS